MKDLAKVLWPPHVALVCKTGDPRVLQREQPPDQQFTAYALGFANERIISGTQEISAAPKKSIIALEHVFKCPMYGAYYLVRAVVRPLEGKMLPQGKLSVWGDNDELLVRGPLSFFLPDPEPLDCMKPYPWEKAEHLYPACPLVNGGADGNHAIGFMFPNMSKVTVFLSDVQAEEPVTLEVGILSAYYSTNKDEMLNPHIEEPKP